MLEVFEALLKAVLIVVGILALIGGGLCVATNLALMPNAIIIVIALGVAVGGGALIWWVVNRQRTKEREGNAKPPHDHPDADQ